MIPAIEKSATISLATNGSLYVSLHTRHRFKSQPLSPLMASKQSSATNILISALIKKYTQDLSVDPVELPLFNGKAALQALHPIPDRAPEIRRH